MNGDLQRRCVDPWAFERRRLWRALVLIASTSMVWHVGRPWVIDLSARASVGCPERERLLAAALRQRGVIADDDALFDDDYTFDLRGLRSHSLPRPGWIAWFGWERPESREPYDLGITIANFADDQMRPRGSYAMTPNSVDDYRQLEAPPGDFDGDGCWEVLVGFNPTKERWQNDLAGYAVLRLREDANEVVWVAVHDRRVLRPTRKGITPTWRDEDGDGRSELVFVLRKSVTFANGERGLAPPDAEAAFGWSGPGGLLVARGVPGNVGITVWSPEKVGELTVPRRTDLAPLLRRLSPVPAEPASSASKP